MPLTDASRSNLADMHHRGVLVDACAIMTHRCQLFMRESDPESGSMLKTQDGPCVASCRFNLRRISLSCEDRGPG